MIKWLFFCFCYLHWIIFIRFSLRSLTDTVYKYDNILVWYCYGSEIFIFRYDIFWMMTRRNWWCQNGANVCFVARSRSSIMTTLFIQLILLLLKLYHTIVLKLYRHSIQTNSLLAEICYNATQLLRNFLLGMHISLLT